MIILTERLAEIAKSINPGERVADIGTDHGYIPLYLIENNISPKVVLADISKGSLLKAKDNCERCFPGMNFDLRLGDGLDILSEGEVDTVILAGIGGLLSVEIIDWDIKKSLSYKKYIFQPRNNSGALRRYLYEQGFTIEKLSLVRENKRICEVMVALTSNNYQGRKSSIDIDDSYFDFPDELISFKNQYTKEYLEECLAKENRIVETIKSGKKSSGQVIDELDEDLNSRFDRIKRIELLLEKI